MRFKSNIPAWLLGASAAAGTGCDPTVVELEGRRGDLAVEGAEEGDCAQVLMLGGPGTGKIEVAALPRASYSFFENSLEQHYGGDDADENSGVGASPGHCGVGPGEYEVSVTLNRRHALREKVVAHPAKQTVVLVYGHTKHGARVSVGEVDLSPPGPGLRRVRFTNYFEVIEPIQLFVYDDADQPLGESDIIPWGETWTGAIPSAATGYRLSPTQPATTPFDTDWPHPAPFETANLPCLDALPLGLVVTGGYFEAQWGNGTSFRGTSHVEELYTYLPPLCYSD